MFNLQIWYIRSPGRDIELFSCHFLSHYHEIVRCSHKSASRSHKLTSRSHKLESRYHKILTRSHKLTSCYFILDIFFSIYVIREVFLFYGTSSYGSLRCSFLWSPGRDIELFSLHLFISLPQDSKSFPQVSKSLPQVSKVVPTRY